MEMKQIEILQEDSPEKDNLDAKNVTERHSEKARVTNDIFTPSK